MDQVSVHVGLANNDWIQMQSWDFKKISPYTATGPPRDQGPVDVDVMIDDKTLMINDENWDDKWW